VHVIERLEYHQGHLPLRNAITQFILAGISLLSGQSVGREGPSVHLGASAGSVLGRALRVPNNGVRVLVGCGVAAAIAAAFNTPLAGVIFAMEVVIMEYSVIGFAPVIIAAVSATTLSRIMFGDDTAFTVPPFSINAVDEIPIVVLMGALIGCIAAVFIRITLFTSGLLINKAIWIRTLLAGFITGCLALLLPQIMGTGYDTVNHVLLAQIGLTGVILLTIAKTITTATAIGLGIPAGLIGPVLFIGAASGSAIGLVAQLIFPEAAESGFYAMLGMAAMMAATLQAPLAALIYLLEMTANQSILLPGMAAVITASLVTRVVFRQESIYRHLLLSRGLDYRNSPMSQALRRVGVASVMDRNVAQHGGKISPDEAHELLVEEPRWILLQNKTDETLNSLLPATDLARYLTELETGNAQNQNQPALNLFKIPAKRIATDSIKIVATLQEAHEKMKSVGCEILFVTGAHGATKDRIYGVITREHIERSYHI
jgi:CIC family chloride channel protein